MNMIYGRMALDAIFNSEDAARLIPAILAISIWPGS